VDVNVDVVKSPSQYYTGLSCVRVWVCAEGSKEPQQKSKQAARRATAASARPWKFKLGNLWVRRDLEEWWSGREGGNKQL
jgi:hypothetical protein